jgi:microcystin-dependent protein
MNMTGLNEISSNKLRLPNTLFTNSTDGKLTIDNTSRPSSVIIKNYDGTGIMRQLTIDQFINMSGINDLYCNRLYINNTLFNLSVFNALSINCQMIRYSYPPLQTRIINPANTKGIAFCPDTSLDGTYNPMSKATDNVIASTSWPAEFNTLTLTCESDTKTGFRIKETETEAYNLKIIEGGLKFSDNTVQTTAITDTYLRNLISSVISQTVIIPSIPIGTILAYGANYSEFLPVGYCWCMGELVRQSSYPQLYAIIGQKFLNNTIPASEYFYLPDLRGAYLKGVGESNFWTNRNPINLVGQIQQANVGSHAHSYTDRGVDSRSVGSGVGATATRPSNSSYWTDGNAYDSNTRLQNDVENRPNSLGVSYIIKY